LIPLVLIVGASGCTASSGVIRVRKSPANESGPKRARRRNETPKNNISFFLVLMIFSTPFVFEKKRI
jgi:hypothetical protein